LNAVTVALRHAEVVAHRVGAPLRALALVAGLPGDRMHLVHDLGPMKTQTVISMVLRTDPMTSP